MKNSAMRRGAAALGVAGASALTLGFLSAGAANADTFIPLPGGHSEITLLDGSRVTLDLTGESALLSGSMVAFPTSRNAWVSGNFQVQVTGPAAESGGYLDAGYLIGCQVTFDANASAGASAELDVAGIAGGATGDDVDTDGTGWDVGGGISLGPGEVAYFYLASTAATMPEPGDDVSPGWDEASSGFAFDGDSASIAFNDQTIGVDGCAGYAQARFFAKVDIAGDSGLGSVVLWGAPFTLG